jgi:hypothetical protein
MFLTPLEIFMEKYEDYVFDEFMESALSATQVTMSGGFTLRQLQNLRATARAVVEAADDKVTEYIDQVMACAKDIDGSTAAAVSLMTGVPIDDFDKYGGLPDESEESFSEE